MMQYLVCRLNQTTDDPRQEVYLLVPLDFSMKAALESCVAVATTTAEETTAAPVTDVVFAIPDGLFWILHSNRITCDVHDALLDHPWEVIDVDPDLDSLEPADLELERIEVSARGDITFRAFGARNDPTYFWSPPLRTTKFCNAVLTGKWPPRVTR